MKPVSEEPILTVQWLEFFRFCQRLGHGEIEKLKIQDGQPVLAEMVKEKIKFS